MSSPDDYDFLDPEIVDDPYPFYAALRENAPVYQVPGTDVFLVSTRQLIEEALEREDDFSANLTGTLMTGADGKATIFDLTALGGTVAADRTPRESVAHTRLRGGVCGGYAGSMVF